MTVSATNSGIEVAYWFIQRAEKDNIFIEDEKLHHLLFTAQLAYARKNSRAVLMPSLFITDENGFSEPNILKMFSLGRPYMPPVKLENDVAALLEIIWKKYAKTSAAAMGNTIKASEAYKQNYKKGEKQVVNINDIVTLFETPVQTSANSKRKMLISQNGPVMVSQWTPRKLSPSVRKGV